MITLKKDYSRIENDRKITYQKTKWGLSIDVKEFVPNESISFSVNVANKEIKDYKYPLGFVKIEGEDYDNLIDNYIEKGLTLNSDGVVYVVSFVEGLKKCI